MKIQYGFLRSKVARRVVWLFFLSAIVPIVATAFFSLTYVSDLLVEQSYKQLKHAGKLYGMAVLDRLLIIDDKLRDFANHQDDINNAKQELIANQTGKQTKALIIHGYEKQIDSLNLELIPSQNLTLDTNSLSPTRKSMLYSQEDPDGSIRIYLRRIVSVENNQITAIVAKLNNEFLWGNKDTLPFSTYLCVINDKNIELFCSHGNYSAILANLTTSSSGEAESRNLTWLNNDETYLAVAWDLFVQSNFTGPNWKIIASRSEADALIPLHAFNKIFPLVILFSLLIVMLLSLIQIRRSMVPLEKLVDGTRRIGNYEFSEPVQVSTEDEFKELADSFNVMATRLEKQFNELKILSEIDRLILTSPDLQIVLASIFDNAFKIISCDYISITLIEKEDASIGWTHIKENVENKRLYSEKTSIPAKEAAILLRQEQALLVELEKQPWTLLETLTLSGASTARVYRILLDDRLRAVFSLGYRTTPEKDNEDDGYVRDIIDRLAVALATADRDEKLYQQAHFDFLTGLPNRQLFNDRLQQHLIQAQRKNQRAALLYLDLDRFKNINDSLGHVNGDKLLHQVAERMQHCVRETDTVSRLGGDEFAIVLSNINSPNDAGKIAEHLIDAIAMPFMIQSRENFITASVGIAIYPEDGRDSKKLLTHADAAMYRAKENGKGRYMFYEESMNKELVHRIEMETAMRHALRRNELVLYYQPQIDTKSAKITGVEALIRWQHPQKGLIKPLHFIPLAEDCGLIDGIGEWVLHTACHYYRKLRDMNIAPGRMAVNISSRQFLNSNFVDVISNIIEETGMAAHELELEITESLLMDRRINAEDIFNRLKQLGVDLAIDDFGTGYSSLSYLKRFPVKTLKIDRSFTRDIPADTQATTLTLSIIAMAHALNMQVIAEGVESKEQLNLLKANRCDGIQGHFISHPLTADGLIQLLDKQTNTPIYLN